MDRRIQKTRKAIREAFIELFNEKNLSDITVSELAQRANIGRKTFYSHYTAVSDVVKEIFNEAVSSLHQMYEEQKNLELSEVFELLNQCLLRDFGFYKHVASVDTYTSIIREFEIPLKNLIFTLYLEKSGLSQEEFNIYAEYITSGIYGMYINWITAPGNLSLEAFTEIAKKALKGSWQAINGQF